jgi:hypothetical protein
MEPLCPSRLQEVTEHPSQGRRGALAHRVRLRGVQLGDLGIASTCRLLDGERPRHKPQDPGKLLVSRKQQAVPSDVSMQLGTGAQSYNPSTQEAEIKRIPVRSQPRANSCGDLISKNPSQKRAGGEAQDVGPKFKSQKSVHVGTGGQQGRKPRHHLRAAQGNPAGLTSTCVRPHCDGLFMAVLGFELRASHLQGRSCNT